MQQLAVPGQPQRTLWATWASQGCVNHAGRAGWKAAHSLPHLQPFPQSSALLARSLFGMPKCVRVAMLMWWSGDHQLRFKEVPGPDRLVSFQPDGFIAPGYSAAPVKLKFAKLMGCRTSAWGPRFLQRSLLPAKTGHWTKRSIIAFGRASLWTVSIFLPCSQWAGHSRKSWNLKWITGQTFPFFPLW